MNGKVSPNRDLSNSGVTTPPNRLTVNRNEAAAMLGISERLLWTWTNSGQIPHVRIGARVLYPVESLRQWLEQQTSGNGR